MPPPVPNRGMVLLSLFGGLILLGGAATGLAWYFSQGTNSGGDSGGSSATDQVAQDGGSDSATTDTKKRKRPKPPPPLPAEEQARVDKAITAGVAYLKKQQDPQKGVWVIGNQLGHNALLALTLLECDVPADDASVKYAIDYVRETCPMSAATYEIALSILMLDKVGTAEDKKLIQMLALRLIHGQSRDGGWTYNSYPPLSTKENDTLMAALKMTQPRSLKDLVLDAKEANVESRDVVSPKVYAKAVEPLAGTLKTIPALQPADKIDQANVLGSDNSNTQFALIALWVAGRNGVPTERALALTAKRFRTSQNADGGWGYPSGSYASMTGAGLLGLGVGHGLSIRLNPDDKNPTQVNDPVIQKGMTAMAGYIGTPLGPKADRPKNRDRAQVNLYYFWTLERVGVMYSTSKIGGKDWYPWGAELLVDNQSDDGSWWCGVYPGSDAWLDTAFALLFLKRANLAQDLSDKVEFVIDAK